MQPECRAKPRRVFQGSGCAPRRGSAPSLEGNASRGLTWGEARAEEEEPGREVPQEEHTHTHQRRERKQHCHASTRTTITLGTFDEAPLPAGGKGGASPHPHSSSSFSPHLPRPWHTSKPAPPLLPHSLTRILGVRAWGERTGSPEREPARVGEWVTPHCHRSGDE